LSLSFLGAIGLGLTAFTVTLLYGLVIRRKRSRRTWRSLNSAVGLGVSLFVGLTRVCAPHRRERKECRISWGRSRIIFQPPPQDSRIV